MAAPVAVDLPCDAYRIAAVLHASDDVGLIVRTVAEAGDRVNDIAPRTVRTGDRIAHNIVADYGFNSFMLFLKLPTVDWTVVNDAGETPLDKMRQLLASTQAEGDLGWRATQLQKGVRLLEARTQMTPASAREYLDLGMVFLLGCPTAEIAAFATRSFLSGRHVEEIGRQLDDRGGAPHLSGKTHDKSVHDMFKASRGVHPCTQVVDVDLVRARWVYKIDIQMDTLILPTAEVRGVEGCEVSLVLGRYPGQQATCVVACLIEEASVRVLGVYSLEGDTGGTADAPVERNVYRVGMQFAITVPRSTLVLYCLVAPDTWTTTFLPITLVAE